MTRNGTMSSLAAVTACALAGAAGAQVCEPRWNDEFAAGADGRVQALHDTPEALYVGGRFESVGGVAAARIAALAGGAWIPLGPGFTFGTGCHGLAPYVLSLLEVNLPGATGLIAGGAIADAGGIPTEAIARWDGDAWRTMGDGLRLRLCFDCCGDVRDMAIFDDGRGPALYAAGLFDTPVHGLARWNGSAWEAVVGDVALEGDALHVHDDGAGPALYIGGSVLVGGPLRNGVARWDGETWTGVGGPLNFVVHALDEFDDGAGPVLVAAGGLPGVGRISRWDGAAWTPLGADFDDRVRALAVFDDGTGPALYAGGDFTSEGGRAISGLAKWDESAGEWVEAAGGVDGRVYALEPAPHEGVRSLVVGGGFSSVGASSGSPVPSQNIARLIGCAPVCYPDCDTDGDLTFFDFLCFQNEFAAQTEYADCDQSGAHDFFDFLCFQNAFAAGCE